MCIEKNSGPSWTVRLSISGRQTDPEGNTQENTALHQALCTADGTGWLFTYVENGVPARLYISRSLAWMERGGLHREGGGSRTEPGEALREGGSSRTEPGEALREGGSTRTEPGEALRDNERFRTGETGSLRDNERSRTGESESLREGGGTRMVFDPAVSGTRCMYETPFGRIPMWIHTEGIALLGGGKPAAAAPAPAGMSGSGPEEKVPADTLNHAPTGSAPAVVPASAPGRREKPAAPFRLSARIRYTLRLDPDYALTCAVTIRAV